MVATVFLIPQRQPEVVPQALTPELILIHRGPAVLVVQVVVATVPILLVTTVDLVVPVTLRQSLPHREMLVVQVTDRL
jgi:hypothetical protein